MTEEQIKEATIGEPTIINDQIKLVEYDLEWPRRFEREAERFRATLGDCALRIEHVGSTSVPGLVAKPIIDMLLAIVDSADEPHYVPALESAGYVLRVREPKWHEHRLFKGPGANINLHVSAWAARRSNGCFCFAIGCGSIEKIVSCTRVRNEHLQNKNGSTCRTMPTQRLK